MLGKKCFLLVCGLCFLLPTFAKAQIFPPVPPVGSITIDEEETTVLPYVRWTGDLFLTEWRLHVEGTIASDSPGNCLVYPIIGYYTGDDEDPIDYWVAPTEGEEVGDFSFEWTTHDDGLPFSDNGIYKVYLICDQYYNFGTLQVIGSDEYDVEIELLGNATLTFIDGTHEDTGSREIDNLNMKTTLGTGWCTTNYVGAKMYMRVKTGGTWGEWEPQGIEQLFPPNTSEGDFKLKTLDPGGYGAWSDHGDAYQVKVLMKAYDHEVVQSYELLCPTVILHEVLEDISDE